jgi:hypothetical protein
MRLSNPFFAPWLGYWAFLANRSSERWDTVVDEIEERTYGTDKMLSDTLGFWTDAAYGWCAAARGMVEALPTLMFVLNPTDTASGKKCVDIFLPSLPHAEPEVAYLRMVRDFDPANKDKVLDECNVVPCVRKRRQLEVELKNLAVPQKEKLKPAVYAGLIHMGESPLAQIVVRVRVPPPPSPNVTARQAKKSVKR